MAIKVNENGLVGIYLLAILNAIVAGKKMQKYKNVKQLKKLNLLFIFFQSLTIFIFQKNYKFFICLLSFYIGTWP